MEFVLLVLLLLAVALAIGGLVAVLLKETPEPDLFLKGMGYALMGNFLITIGPLPLPVTQIIGLVMASRAEYNSNSRFGALMVGVVLRLVSWLWSIA